MEASLRRRRAITAFLAIAAGLITFTSLEFMLEAVQDDFSMSPDETMVVSQIASGACLLVVFLAGTLADRLGERRVLSMACSTSILGAVVVGTATDPGLLLLGLCLGGVGTIAMAIVGLAVLNSTFPETAARARAFGLFAVIAPAVAIVVPLITSVIVPQLGWRWVTLLWVAVGGGTLLLARTSLSSPQRSAPRRELLTPTLAGVALAGVALAFSYTEADSSTHQHSDDALRCAVVGAIALMALVVAMRLLPTPTLDLRSLRSRGASAVFATVFVVNGVNLFFFTYLLLQYRYHQSLTETAVLLIIPQASAALGAILGGRLSARWSSGSVATVSLVAAAVLSLGALTIAGDSPVWLPVLVLTAAAVPIAAAVGPITQSAMDLAPADGIAATSSARNSAANLGVAIAGLVSATLVFDELDADTDRTIEAYRQQAEAFHLAGVLCAVAYLCAALLMVIHRRRRRIADPVGSEAAGAAVTSS